LQFVFVFKVDSHTSNLNLNLVALLIGVLIVSLRPHNSCSMNTNIINIDNIIEFVDKFVSRYGDYSTAYNKSYPFYDDTSRGVANALFGLLCQL
jgi:hypothetical protein